MARQDVEKRIYELEAEMKKAAENLDFEKAITLRDAMEEMKEELKTI